MRLTASNKASKLAELAELDSKVRSFLEMVMGELGWRQTLICVPVALCIRLLFLLHGSVLDTLQHSKSETDHQKRDMSWSGLDMERNKLVVDEALSRDIDSLLSAEEEYRKTWVF
ncbi:hypothetical protein HO133_009883 [Letharia lupina]|uniref:Uncharacterized protein n=1 Tax=Letharia lupina TaxID=560253 RepID=A0A8H6CMB0_9LECA|nr:uncharacterized protein HO133_009883 [Letharia lupina]KAF6225881.1 hypothetical protein HO133_009883 [Letharia lupina]